MNVILGTVLGAVFGVLVLGVVAARAEAKQQQDAASNERQRRGSGV